jgi:acetoin utilization protein AcuC
MHEAAAAVAGGSMRAIEAILRGDVEHAFHPGGGLHHAMRDRASGFCIYDDPALAIAVARQAGLRVLYLDFDVHHGDGVQALFLDDPGVLTVSFHESGRYLFPGTGFVNELGWGEAAGTSVNMPFQPPSGEGAWLGAVRTLVPQLAAAFGPDIVVSQHGADSHAWDPLAHMLVTTTAMGEAARLTDTVAHRHAQGRWLATGGGGYDAYRVVPRSWSLVWLAGAHRDTPDATPEAWRERWAAEAARYDQSPLPATFDDPPNAGIAVAGDQERAEGHSAETLHLVRGIVIPRLLRVARERRWWRPDDPAADAAAAASGPTDLEPTIVSDLTPAALERLTLAARVLPPADPIAGRTLLVNAARDGAQVIAAIAGDQIVGAAVLAPTPPKPDGLAGGWELAAVGVAPAHRQRGLATVLVRAAVAAAGSDTLIASSGVAERDVVEPLPVETRAAIARRLLETAGFRVRAASGAVGQADAAAITAAHG